MPSPFARTTRALLADGHARTWSWIAAIVVLLAAWSAWFAIAKIPVYAVSEHGRIEARSAAHVVQPEVSGKVIAVHATLGDPVDTGDILFELDSEATRFARDYARARKAAALDRVASLREQIAVEAKGIADARDAAGKASGEARARERAAAAASTLAQHEATQAETLAREGALAELERVRIQNEARQRGESAEASRFAATRVGAESRRDESDRLAHLESLNREIVELRGEADQIDVQISDLERAIDRHRVRAPIAGIVGEVAEIRLGAVVAEGERLAAVVPPGDLRIVAELSPSSAVGRVAPGQRARMRLDGFPWTQYGVLVGVVERVATEARGGRIRVELDVEPDPTGRIPVQHGLLGVVEIEVEQVTPLTLVLRAAGSLLASPSSRRAVGEHG